MNTIPCDIVLLPSDELAQKAIAASQLLANHDSLFTLEIGKYFPHMSLYMFELNADDISKVELILQHITEKTSTMFANAREYKIANGQGVGYVYPEYEVTTELQTIQMNVVEAIYPIRAGMREKDKAKMAHARGEHLENLQKYGYATVGKLFRPHVTLTRLKEYKPEVLKVLPPIETFSGTFLKLGFFEMGDNDTCVRMIKSFDLQP